MANPPAKRRITPIAVAPQDQATSAAFSSEQPLCVEPPPAAGSTKEISACGRGRRVWIDIKGTVQISFKEVLRQQGLDYATWKQGMQQGRLQAAGADKGTDAKRQGFTGLLMQRVQKLYQVSDEDESEEDDEDEESGDEDGNGEAGTGEEVGEGRTDAEQDEDDDDDDDDDDDTDEKETVGEVDLEKEEDTKGRAKPKRQRFERYDDDFIDDSELEMVKGGAPVKTKYAGFYVVQGGVETLEAASKPRAKPRPRAPKQPGTAGTAAAGAAAAGNNGSGAAAGSGAGAAKKRKHQQQAGQQGQTPQQEQQQQPGAAQKRKRPRADNAGPDIQDNVRAGNRVKSAQADAGSAYPPTAKAVGNAASKDPSVAQAAAVGTGDAGANAQTAPGAGGTAKTAMLAALQAAKQKPKLVHSATGGSAAVPEATGSAQAHQATAAAAATAVPTATSMISAAAAESAGASNAAKTVQQEQPVASSPTAAATARLAASVAAARRHSLTSAPSSPNASFLAAETAAVGKEDAAPGGAAGGDNKGKADGSASQAVNAAAAAVQAGFAADIVSGIAALQRAVEQHKPPPPESGRPAVPSKAVRHALDHVAYTFARLPQQQQRQQEQQLVDVVGPVMAPYMKSKKLKKLLIEEPASKLTELQGTRDTLMEQLNQIRSAAATPVGGRRSASPAGVPDEDFQQPWSAAAEEALISAWAAAQHMPEQLNQLAQDVCSRLGWAHDDPQKAVAELKQTVNKARRKATAASKKAAAAVTTTAAGGGAADASTQPGTLSLQPTDSGVLAEGLEGRSATVSGQASGHVSATSAAEGITPQRSQAVLLSRVGTPRLVSVPLAYQAAGTEGDDASAAGTSASNTAAAAGTASQKQDRQEKFSTLSVPSPRLQRCFDAAEAAGASQDWLHSKYQTLRSQNMHQMFRTLCLASPKGLPVNQMVAAAAEHGLGFTWDDSTSLRSALKGSLQSNTMSGIVGVTDADPKCCALLCFDGVSARHKQGKQPKPAVDAGGITATEVEVGRCDAAPAEAGRQQ